MKTLAFLATALLATAFISGVDVNAQMIDITAMEANTMIQENEALTVIDVSPLYASGHIPGALNLQVSTAEFISAIPDLDRDAPYLIYCHTDEASTLAADKLVEAGFSMVYRLYGNFGAWQSAGYASETPMYSDISAADALTMIESNPDIIVVDVSPHYTSGHLPGAISLSLGDGTLDKAKALLDRNAEYLVYCHSDEASMAGAQALVDAGFTRVTRLEGNYSGWTGAGYTTETSSLSYSDISAADANAFIGSNPELVVIDVSPHWAEGHLPGARSYYWGDATLQAAIPKLSKDADILLYCHTDEVSMAGAQALADAGFANVRRLAGNYSGWINGSYTVETPSYTDVSAADAKMLIEGSMPPVVIDVSPLYRNGHLPGAVHYYVGDNTIGKVARYLDPNGDYLVYCHSDGASMQGAQALVSAGFSQVKRLEGNFGGWVSAGYNVVIPPPEYHDITPAAAKELIDSTAGLTIVDVSPLYDDGHIPDAVNFPFGTGAFDDQIPEFDMNGTFLIYCHADEPARGASKALYDAGFESVYRLYGNYDAWVEAGYETTTGTAVEDTVPGAFSLSGAYPNPFNPTTAIRFEIPSDGIAKLTVYDTLGRKVAELLNEHRSAGVHEIRWNGRDSSGHTLGSGTYIVRLSSAGLTARSKVALVR